MNVWVVSPEMEGMSNQSEVDAFTSDHVVFPRTPLSGFVSNLDIAHEVAISGPCDVLALLTHADENGVWLSEKPYLTAMDVARYAHILRVKLVYLNTCSSPEFIQELLDRLRVIACDLIYYDGQLPDVEAVTMTVLFSAALADSGDFFIAYERVVLPGSRYHYRTAHRGGRDRAAVSEGALRVEVDGLIKRIEQLSAVLVMMLLVVVIFAFIAYQQTETIKGQIVDLRLGVAELRSHVDFLERGKP